MWAWVIYYLVMAWIIAACVVAALILDGPGAAAGPIAGLIMWLLVGAFAFILIRGIR